MEAPVQLVPFAHDPLAAAARLIIDRHRERLPDLTHCCILVPDLSCAPALRRALLEAAAAHGADALLGPVISGFEDWLAQGRPLEQEVLNRPAQELVLVEAIRQAPGLFGDTDAWLLGDRLLSLFDELTRHQVQVATRYAEFSDSLQQAYGISGTPPSPFTREARMLHTLWHAWHEQLADEGQLDPASAHLLRLAADRHQDDPDPELWLLGFTDFTPAETAWLAQRLQTDQARLLTQVDITGAVPLAEGPLAQLLDTLPADLPTRGEPEPYSRCLDAVFRRDGPTLVERARDTAAALPEDPLRPRLRVFTAAGPEQEAQAIELQVRRWLIEGRRAIGIVSEERRLARRVRALLERAGVALQDRGGWALSTTSAAAVLERWLETVEEDFACAPLLDVLKSPFAVPEDERDPHLALVRRFEQDIILHENIARGLARYRHHLRRRSERLPDWSEQTRRALEQLLNRLDHAAEPLRELLSGSHPAAHFTAALGASLAELGVQAGFEQDPAGRAVLQEIDGLHGAAGRSGLAMQWAEFRSWLGRTLERHRFVPAAADSPVQLLTLSQSRLQRFDGLIIAACTRTQLPGSPVEGGFFNPSVRAELGLPGWRQTLASKRHDFRRLLESAPRLLLTRQREHDGEPVAASPWLALLETFHRNAWGGDLADDELETLLRTSKPAPQIDPRPLPAGPGTRPAPALSPALRPARWTASSHQRLLDCPYRFFAADGLRLAAPEEIREALEKADYGEYVHRILQAFHAGVGGLPGPWKGRLDSTAEAQACTLLERISRAVFADALQDSFLAHGWLKQWLGLIPRYVNWQIAREPHWTFHSAEQEMNRRLGNGVELRGRLDRIDRHRQALAVIDYKTGAVPARAQVEQGEAVQLPSYALLAGEAVTEVAYLRLAGDTVDDRLALRDEALRRLAPAVGERLGELAEAIDQGAALPAWGDPGVCAYCEFDGVCRRDSGWDESSGAE